MTYLFKCFSIKAWKGTNVDVNKHKACDRIVNQHYMNYYFKCWKDRNERLHDEEVQGKRMIEWQQKECARTLEAQHLQVRRFSIEKNRGINVHNRAH